MICATVSLKQLAPSGDLNFERPDPIDLPTTPPLAQAFQPPVPLCSPAPFCGPSRSGIQDPPTPGQEGTHEDRPRRNRRPLQSILKTMFPMDSSPARENEVIACSHCLDNH